VDVYILEEPRTNYFCLNEVMNHVIEPNEKFLGYQQPML